MALNIDYDHIKVNKETLDKAMLRFTLQLYNNPLICRKAINFVIDEVDNLISNMIIS